MSAIDQVLKNLFAPETTITLFGAVDEQITPGRYKLIDDSGQIFYATSNDFYPIGTKVRVTSGVIDGRANLAGTHRTYEV